MEAEGTEDRFAGFLADIGAIAMGSTTYNWVLDHERVRWLMRRRVEIPYYDHRICRGRRIEPLAQRKSLRRANLRFFRAVMQMSVGEP